MNCHQEDDAIVVFVVIDGVELPQTSENEPQMS